MSRRVVASALLLLVVLGSGAALAAKKYASIQESSDGARSAASASEFGGGMPGGTAYVKRLYEVGKLTTELADLGVEIKDYTRGLIDFPSLRGDRVVLLCWQLGEGESIEWWHETEDGFAGRQRL